MADESDGDLPWIAGDIADEEKTDQLALDEIAEAAEAQAVKTDPTYDDSDEFVPEAPGELDEFSRDDYLSTTTTEYQDLAEEIRKMESETVQMQAVAAPLHGVDSGVVGFEDVTGTVEVPIERTKPSGDLPVRIVSGLTLVGLLIGSAILGGGWFVGFIVLAAIISVGEFYSATRTAGYKPIALFGLLAAIGAPIAGYRAGPGGVAGTVILSIVAVLVFYTMLIRRDPLDNASVTIFGIVWIPGMLGFATAIGATAEAAQLIIGLVLISAAVDTGSFFAGRAFGKTPMAPVLSPNKTWEGLAGGAAGAAAMTMVISLLEYFSLFVLPGSLWLALAIFITSPLGDIAESMIKRSLGIKDMGSIIPGHGGLLDRVDALLFAVPIGYFVYQTLGYL
ncbi:MAG: phosphatidate cytidylyltransferase [Acidimicrobiia bacterium]|nr:phosphatidate cytidylyltransferase [Acidimicrobiia bacterium]MDH5503472.1 phosphatidate cytidylyltransferase [Acidimicrobiia bacterium]